MIHISSDWSEIDREIERVESMPTPLMREKLDAVLDWGFTLTQSAVHVRSGKLKKSGRQSSDHEKMAHNWVGEIGYGESDEVDYAIYEKRRGVHWVGDSAGKGDHDFFRPLNTLPPIFVMAIKEGLGK